MIRLIYFDTNFFYDLANNKLSKDDLNEFGKYVDSRQIKLYYTPITFNEIVKHINDREKSRFTYYKKLLAKTHLLCGNNILDYPDRVLAQILNVSPEPVNKTTLDLNRLRDLICATGSYKLLIQTKQFRDYKKTIKVWLNIRKKWKRRIDRFVRGVIASYNTRKKYHKSMRVTDRKMREKLLAQLHSHEFDEVCVDATLSKATNVNSNGLIGSPSSAVVKRTMKKLSAYFTTFKAIIRNIIEHGYCVQENDFDDVHFLIYLGLGKHIQFLTHDDKLRKKIRGCEQAEQVGGIGVIRDMGSNFLLRR